MTEWPPAARVPALNVAADRLSPEQLYMSEWYL